MIDTHCHLGLCEQPDAELVAAASAVGVRRMLTVGIDEAGGEEAIAAAEANEGVYAAVGRHPNGAAGFDDAAAARIEELARTRASPRSARPGSTSTATHAPRDDQRHAFEAHIPIARRLPKPLVIHVRDSGTTTDGEALEETFEHPARRGRRRDRGPALLLRHRRARRARRPSGAGTARSPAT